MSKKKTGWPFQEGYIVSEQIKRSVFTDYRWNDGSVSRLWHVDPDQYDPLAICIRPFSLSESDESDQ
nr:hypothetical protein [uncultured Celeribacter sp.]